MYSFPRPLSTVTPFSHLTRPFWHSGVCSSRQTESLLWRDVKQCRRFDTISDHFLSSCYSPGTGDLKMGVQHSFLSWGRGRHTDICNSVWWAQVPSDVKIPSTMGMQKRHRKWGRWIREGSQHQGAGEWSQQCIVSLWAFLCAWSRLGVCCFTWRVQTRYGMEVVWFPSSAGSALASTHSHPKTQKSRLLALAFAVW